MFPYFVLYFYWLNFGVWSLEICNGCLVHPSAIFILKKIASHITSTRKKKLTGTTFVLPKTNRQRKIWKSKESEVMNKVSVLGAGAWGTTLAQVLVDAGQDVLVWGRNAEVVSEINSLHTNKKFLPGVNIPSAIRATTDISEAFSFGQSIVLAIPAQSLRENLAAWKESFPKNLKKPFAEL